MDDAALAARVVSGAKAGRAKRDVAHEEGLQLFQLERVAARAGVVFKKVAKRMSEAALEAAEAAREGAAREQALAAARRSLRAQVEAGRSEIQSGSTPPFKGSVRRSGARSFNLSVDNSSGTCYFYTSLG